MFERVEFEEGGSQGPGRVYDRRGAAEMESNPLGSTVRGIVGSIGEMLPGNTNLAGNPFPRGTALNPNISGNTVPGRAPGSDQVRRGRGSTPADDWSSLAMEARPAESTNRLTPDQVISGGDGGQVNAFARAIRRAESDSDEGDYRRIRGMVRGQYPLLGAYAIAADDWHGMAADAGLVGASWTDQRAQDHVAKSAFKNLYSKYGDWRWVAMAWKAGEANTDVIRASPELLEDKTLTPLKEWVRGVMTNVQDAITVNVGGDGDVPREAFRGDFDDYNVGQGFIPDTSARPIQYFNAGRGDAVEDTLRRRLYAMRERTRAMSVSEEGEEPVPEENVPVRRGRGQGAGVGRRAVEPVVTRPKKRFRNRSSTGVGTGGIQEQ